MSPTLTGGPISDSPTRATVAAAPEAAPAAHADVDNAALRTTGLTKRFGTRTAVDGVTFAVPRGVVCGFVGPNGSGKTTTIRMLLGLAAPSAGTAEVLGASIAHPGLYLPRVGALIEGPAFYPTLSGRRNLQVLATLGGLPHARIDEVLDVVGLRGRAGDDVRSYSLGMKQRLGIAAALLPRPDLLVLDEPANGLDPAGILEMRGLLRGLASEGVTVFISSHLLSEVEQMSDWIVVLLDGRLVASGAVGDVLATRRPWLIVAAEEAGWEAALPAVATRLGFGSTLVDGRLRVDAPAGAAGAVNRAAMEAGFTLTELSVHRPTLEATFLEITGGVSR
ncbi:MAG TPA: ABC transporter ATP-binding protein [Candidatus Dormibacteraeota bacterium]|nr:ABC transporter ATP-binding protein [Candidatus Dormibacteraeota bacterium]